MTKLNPGESSGRPGDFLRELGEDIERNFGGSKYQGPPSKQLVACVAQQIPADYYYTTEEGGEGAKECGYVFERECGNVYLEPGEDRVPINRYHHPVDVRHFYSDDAGGENVQAYGWVFDGTKFYICAKENVELLGYPWHRNKLPNGAYFLGMDGERPKEIHYEFERRLGYILDLQLEETVPLYRWVRWNAIGS